MTSVDPFLRLRMSLLLTKESEGHSNQNGIPLENRLLKLRRRGSNVLNRGRGNSPVREVQSNLGFLPSNFTDGPIK